LADIRAAAAVQQVMVAGTLHTVDQLLAPFAGTKAVAPATVVSAAAPQPLSREKAHAHDPEYWWHEPEWLHRLCCEG
jgi:hypothetical protein